MELITVDPRTLIENPENPRRKSPPDQADVQMEATARAIGILQPPVVREVPKGYMTIYGHRRVRGAIAAGLTEIRVLVLGEEMDADDDRLRALVENIARKSMSPVEQWRAIEKLVSERWTEEAISTALVLPVRTIRKLRLLAGSRPCRFRLSETARLRPRRCRFTSWRSLMSDDPAPQSKLPPRCFARSPSTGETIAVIRGEAGYHPVVTVQTVEQLNASLPEPPTAQQVEAMLAGSMFGWNVSAALVRDGPASGSIVGHVAFDADACAPVPAVADWGGPDTPFQLVGCNPLRPGLSRSLDRLWAHAAGHLGFYGWLRVANRRMDRVFLCGLLDLPAHNWRDEYDGRVPPAEAADVAIDEYASRHGTGPVQSSAQMPLSNPAPATPLVE